MTSSTQPIAARTGSLRAGLFGEILSMAFDTLRANKLRSALTILGLMIGVGSVIVLIAVGNGSSKAVAAQIEALGSNVLLVTSGGGIGGSQASNAAPRPLTVEDASALVDREQAPA
jgi:putative ABC transport system permease protein